MISRDPDQAVRSRWDLLIVGGGIQGISLALEAARRGLEPLLLERRDFGGATSWNSLRIVHGGLRYLQTLDLARFRELVRERRWWLAHFPDLVRPLPCLMPLYGRGLHRPSVLRLALAMNDLFAWDRNRAVPVERQLSRGRVLSASETVKAAPFLDRSGLSGAALWYDGSMPDSQRLLVEMLHWATACGGTALNYVEAQGLLVRKGKVEGVKVLDGVSGGVLELEAPVVVNCAGPWCREVARAFDRDHPDLFHSSVAFNILLDREPLSPMALAVAPKEPGARTYFLHPWKGKILAGTYHAPWSGDRPTGEISEDLLARFLKDLNAAIPGSDFRREEILRVHWGLLPAREPSSEVLAVREVILDHGSLGGPEGLFSVSGVKFTSARSVAETTLRRIQDSRGVHLGSLAGVERPEPTRWPTRAEVDSLLDSDEEAAGRWIGRLVHEESVCRLEDLTRRRTDWAVDPRQETSIAERIEHLLGLPR